MRSGSCAVNLVRLQRTILNKMLEYCSVGHSGILIGKKYVPEFFDWFGTPKVQDMSGYVNMNIW
jgi:hypothetical protein